MLGIWNCCHNWFVMSRILLNCWGEKGWGAEPDTEITITFSKLFHCASCIFRLILWLAHNRFLQTVISEENNWMKLQVLKITTFKCRGLNLTNLVKAWMIYWLLMLGSVYFTVFLKFFKSWQNHHVYGEEIPINETFCYYYL